MKNAINLWMGTVLTKEVDKQILMLAKALFTWGISSTLIGICSLIEFSTISLAVFIFIFLQLFIKVSTVGIYEGDSKTTVNKAILKSELFSNTLILATAIIFYVVFSGTFPLTTTIISLVMFGISFNSYKKK